MQPRIITGVVAGLTDERLSLDFISVMRYHSSSNCASIRFHSLQLDLEPVLFALKIVSQKRGGLIHVHDKYVQVAVVIEIAKCTAAAAMSRHDTFAGLRLQFLKSAVAQVTKQNAWSLVGILRQRLFNLGIHTACYKEHIRVPVVIQVNHPRAPACEARLYTRLRGSSYLIEIRLPVIPIKTTRVADKMRLEKVQVPVEVIVSDPDAHSSLFHSIVT